MGIVRQVRIHVRTIGALAVVVATLAIASGPAWAQQSRPGDSLVELTRLARTAMCCAATATPLSSS